MTIQCYSCKRTATKRVGLAAAGWDWFTNYLPQTVYFCPRCSNSQLRHEQFAISRKKPEAPNAED